MYLVSTGKKTVLSDFNALETKSIYQHAKGETRDFQFYEQKRIFVEVNKKAGLEIMRIKEKPHQKLELQRVRKLNIENVYCVACAKRSMEEMALGLSNGQIRLYNYKNSEFVHRFNADNIRNSVLYLDYNASDEYMSSVFESGQINIYGIKTKTRIDTLNIDNSSTLARFHPTKRLQLSIASYKGSVTIYDIQSKRKIYHSSEAHMSPCRDLCMCVAAPDTLISVGFDCIINIFDTRRKTQPQRLTYCHPLSTVAMSECGTYFCVGNLKGELSTFDMRNTSACLETKRIHDCAITRIAFVPHDTEVASGSFSSTSNQTLDTTDDHAAIRGNVNGLRKSIIPAVTGTTTTTRKQRDSFCDFLDFHTSKGTEKMSARFSTNRDSFDWDMLARKPPHDEHRLSMPNNCSGLSNANDSGESVDNKVLNINHAKMLSTITAPLRDRNAGNRLSQCVGEKLVQIQEEQPQTPQQLNNSNGSDKENPIIDLELSNRLSISHGIAGQSSTPNRASLQSQLQTPIGNSKVTKPNVPPPAPPTANGNSPTTTTTTKTSNTNSNDTDLSRQIAELRVDMLARFQQLESELKFTAETNKWHIFTHAFNLWSKQYDRTSDISEALGILLQTDPFVNEFMRLKDENEKLKAQLKQFS